MGGHSRFAFRFEGIYTPLITPHLDDLTIDRDGLIEQIDHLIDVDVHGLVLGGSTGEYYAQSMEERIDLMQFVRDHVSDRIPLIIGTGATRTEDCILYARAARDNGAAAILVTSPPYAVPTERENALHALAIERACNLPVMLYNYPGRMSVEMGEDYLNRVGRTSNICAIKESSGDINRVHLLARDYPHIQMSCGMDDQALEFFAWGARSWVCAGSNFLPEEHIALYQTCVIDGDFEKGRKIMSAMMPLMRVLEQGGKFVQCVKHGVEFAGRRAGPPRAPLRPLNKDDKRELEQVIRVLKTSIAEITGTEPKGNKS